MRGFVERTRVDSHDGARHRYLWTDAFAVCNLLALQRATGDVGYLTLARQLVARVHEGLGRHRPDDARQGWISGLGEDEGRAHPTRGGLRIGKPEPERGAHEALDPAREWDRDGQYFHYLTRWMHALARLADATREPRYLVQAVELAEAAHRGFTYRREGRPGMHWKASIDLSRPLVPSAGNHDPVDGLVTASELRAALAGDGDDDPSRLDAMLDDMRAMCAEVSWPVEDPLGIGCLLTAACTLAQLRARRSDPAAVDDAALLPRMLEGALQGLHEIPEDFLRWPTGHRLAFRELGLAIGLRAVPRLGAVYERDRERLGGAEVGILLAALERHLPLGHGIEACWQDPAHHGDATWREHRDIHEVMLATALVPDGYLDA